VDIKQMYERWTVGELPSSTPSSVAYPATEGLPAKFLYPPPTGTNTPYILQVHGYNMQVWEKDRYAETAYKRLYWQGYQGRFGAFHWPTAQNAILVGYSELQSWDSAAGLLNLLTNLNAEYPGKVYLAAHSMGNVASGEALRLAGTNRVVNTYVAMQGAVPAHAYDPNTLAHTLSDDNGAPDCYAYYWTNGAPCYFTATAGAGTYVNFLNTNDWALGGPWLEFQNQKPNLYPTFSYTSPNDYEEGLTRLYFPANTYVIFNALIQARCYALGAQLNVNGAFTGNQNELDVAPYSFGSQHIYHSGEFRSDNPQRWQFWNRFLIDCELKTP
jgi:hypothetical protein